MKTIIASVFVLFLIFLGSYLGKEVNAPDVSLGSIIDGQAYNSTTTSSSWNTPALSVGGTKLLKTGSGTFGSVIITNETAGSFNVYDATSTNHGDHATTTLAQIYASVAENTYTFDSVFTRGLLIEFQSSNVASSTITWR